MHHCVIVDKLYHWFTHDRAVFNVPYSPITNFLSTYKIFNIAQNKSKHIHEGGMDKAWLNEWNTINKPIINWTQCLSLCVCPIIKFRTLSIYFLYNCMCSAKTWSNGTFWTVMLFKNHKQWKLYCLGLNYLCLQANISPVMSFSEPVDEKKNLAESSWLLLIPLFISLDSSFSFMVIIVMIK